MGEHCTNCGSDFDDGGDGYNGECASCADLTEQIEQTIEKVSEIGGLIAKASAALLANSGFQSSLQASVGVKGGRPVMPDLQLDGTQISQSSILELIAEATEDLALEIPRDINAFHASYHISLNGEGSPQITYQGFRVDGFDVGVGLDGRGLEPLKVALRSEPVAMNTLSL
jgi:hypothetical protein